MVEPCEENALKIPQPLTPQATAAPPWCAWPPRRRGRLVQLKAAPRVPPRALRELVHLVQQTESLWPLLKRLTLLRMHLCCVEPLKFQKQQAAQHAKSGFA